MKKTRRRSKVAEHRAGAARSTKAVDPSLEHLPPGPESLASPGGLVIDELEDRCVPGGTLSVKLSKRTAGWGC
jgi:hypothetical protein